MRCCRPAFPPVVCSYCRARRYTRQNPHPLPDDWAFQPFKRPLAAGSPKFPIRSPQMTSTDSCLRSWANRNSLTPRKPTAARSSAASTST